MLDFITESVQQLSSLVSVNNPAGLAAIFGLVLLADIGIIIPFIIEPALFLITFQSGPFSLPVLLFVLMMAAGRQAGTAILYGLSLFAGDRIGRLIKRFFPKFAGRFSRRLVGFKKRLGNHRSMALATARLTPGLLQVSTVASAVLHINFTCLMLGVFISGIIYDAAIVLLGGLAHYGLRWVDERYSLFIALGAAVLIGLISYIIGRVRRKKGAG